MVAIMKKHILLAVAAAAVLVLVWVAVKQWLALREVRQELRHMFFAAIRPVRLSNCTLERFGSPHDGGYLLCSNLLDQVKSAYSYGISGDDNWGCDVAKRYQIPVHQYDCFDLRRPGCPGGLANFHEECVGGTAERDGKRVYDSVASQVLRNGDEGKHLVVKMDVEGAELDALQAIPESLLQRIDQLVVEFHSIDKPQDIRLLDKLDKVFHVAYVHANNYACRWGEPPFSSGANEILFVNRRLGVVEGATSAPVQQNPLAASNYPKLPECQPRWP